MAASSSLAFADFASAVSIPQAPSYETLAERFRPIFARIAAGAVAREQSRELPHEPIAWLLDAGFGTVRIPQRYGGLGATVPQFFRLLTELGEADSNVSHLFRGHFAFLEGRLVAPEESSREFWFQQVLNGAFIGYAMAERTEATGGTTTLTRDGEDWIVHGTKYYSTGTLYADWIVAAVNDGVERVMVAVPADAPGVTRLDDWDGFGQRLTGSGTTKFDRVRVAPEQIIRRFSDTDISGQAYQKSFLQLVLLATLTGISRAVVHDAVAFVQPRTRAFGVPGISSPREDPLVQRVIGKLASLSFAAECIVEQTANVLETVYQSALSGLTDEALCVAAEVKAYQAQQTVISLVLEATTLLFEVGGASATSDARRLDRHWRNARTAASHNPAIHRERAIGDYYLNGTIPDGAWREFMQKKNSAEPTAAAAQP